jgi:hypothetical protein
MRTLVYEHILSQKHLYLININEASFIIIKKMVEGKPKTTKAINRFRPLVGTNSTILHGFKQNKKKLNLHYIILTKTFIKQLNHNIFRTT